MQHTLPLNQFVRINQCRAENTGRKKRERPAQQAE
jgi:hypothetical protein